MKELNEKDMSRLLEHFRELDDPRIERCKKHLLLDIVVIAICAVIGGADNFVDIALFGRAKRDWFKKFLQPPEGIPSHDTFGRVFAKLDPLWWQSCLLDWVRYTLNGKLRKGDVIGLDGKCLRGTREDEERATYLVNAWSTTLGISLAQTKVTAKSNEISALPDLIETLDLFDVSGCTLTIDAMGTQRDIARLVMEKDAQYVLALKKNQPTLYEAVAWLFEDAFKHNFLERPHSYLHTQELGHGREEQRRCWVLGELSYLEAHAWPGLQSVVLIESQPRG